MVFVSHTKFIFKALSSIIITVTFVIILMLSSSTFNYASAKSSFDFSGVPDIIIETEEPNNQYIVNPDYVNFFDDVAGFQVIKNTAASDAKNVVIQGGDTVTLSFDCKSEGCGFVDDVAIYLVSVRANDKDIADAGEEPERIDIAHIDCSQVNCEEPFDITFPDVDNGKYKLVIDRDEDEAHFFYINKISIV
jgi:hypothetical protein